MVRRKASVAKSTLFKVNRSSDREVGETVAPSRKDRRAVRCSIAGDGCPGPEVRPSGPFEPSISGCLPGDLGVPGYEPDGISWLPHPAAFASSGRPATAVDRPHWTVPDKPIAGRLQKNLRKRARSSRLPFRRILPVA